ncbi:MAG: ABC transporter permease [Bacteroidota bacterium]|nr:ABC transporter permease [Bacteroidota bacterium]
MKIKLNFNSIRQALKENRMAWLDMFYILRKELYGIFTDSGVIIIFFIATLVYPLAVCFIYNKEALRDAPIAVVDNSHSSLSRKYIRMIDATPEVKVEYECMSMLEAKELQRKGKVHGIINIPKTFSKDINTNRQTFVNVFADVSSFFWYRNLSVATSYVGRTMGYEIEAKGLIAKGSTYDDAVRNVRKFIPQENVLYNPGGYPSFLAPIVLIILIQQTIMMGIGMMAGKTTERSRWRDLTPNNVHYRGLFRVIFGRALAVFIVYVPISIYLLIIIPHIFNLPALMSSPLELFWFIIPFLFASIFLGMTISTLFYHRENAIPVYIFMSIPILLMSGFSWPREAMPEFWKLFSFVFPSTFASNGFIRMNTMGASLWEISTEHLALWIQVAVYLSTTFVAYRLRLTRKARQERRDERRRLRKLFVKKKYFLPIRK